MLSWNNLIKSSVCDTKREDEKMNKLMLANSSKRWRKKEVV